MWGPDSVLPKSPADLPEYKSTVTQFSSDAMNIVYVEYDMPGASRMPFSAAPDKDGNLWIPNFGVADKITRLNPNTGEMTDFPTPFQGTAGIHSAVPAADGSVWLTPSKARIGKDAGNPRRRKLPNFRTLTRREKKAPKKVEKNTRFASIRAATRGRVASR